jgi:hypothetical protein
MKVTDVVWRIYSPKVPEPLLEMKVDGRRVIINKEQKFIRRGVYIVFLPTDDRYFTETLPPMTVTPKEVPWMTPGAKKVLRGFTADRQVMKVVLEYMTAISKGVFWDEVGPQ